jgi:ComF family protein
VFIETLLNFFLKSNCPLCQRPTSQEFCDSCFKQLQQCCLPNPYRLWHQPLPVFSWGAYGGTLKRAIAALKYQNQPQIARPLGQWLAEAWVSNVSINTQCVVVPIPMHPHKQKERGYNQAALIAKSFCETTGLRLKLNGLERVQETEALYPLSATEREKELAKAFGIGKDFIHGSKASVLLIDDIYTTGSTVKSAMKTLHQAGISVLGVATTATTQKGV